MTVIVERRPAVASSAQAVVPVLVALLGLLLLLVFVGFAILYVNFPIGYDVPFGLSLGSRTLFNDLWPYPVLTIAPAVFGQVATGLTIAMWAVYLIGFLVVRGCVDQEARRRLVYVVGGVGVLANVVLVIALPPILSSDIYQYALFGRMVALHGLNPYGVPATAASHDPVWPLVFWRGVTTHYGPVWTTISAAVAAVAGEGVLPTVIGFKTIAAIGNVVNVGLVYVLARRLTGGDGLVPVLLYAWNPLILVETAGSGHNDAVMMTLALTGLLLVLKERPAWGVAFLTASVLVKYLSALLLFFVVVHVVRVQLEGARGAKVPSFSGSGTPATFRRETGLELRPPTLAHAVRLVGRLAVAGLVVVVGFFLPFWAGPSTIQGILFHASASSSSVTRVLLRDWALRTFVGPAATTQQQADVERYVAAGTLLVFAVIVVAILWAMLRLDRPWSWVVERWTIASLVYLAIAYAWSFPWYFISPLTTTFICPPTRTNLRLNAVATALAIALTLFYAALVPR